MLKKTTIKLIFILSLIGTSGFTIAKTPNSLKPTQKEFQQVREKIQTLLGQNYQLINLTWEENLGMFQAESEPFQEFFFSRNSNFFIAGSLYQIDNSNNLTNLSEKKAEQIAATKIKAIPKQETIVFKSKKENHKVYVFTDILCPYCQKFHQQINEFNNLGISIVYLAYPVIRANSASIYKSIWCNARETEASIQSLFAQAKNAPNTFKENQCEGTPVDKQLKLGNSLNIRGTPAIFLESGYKISGYITPSKLLKMINEKKS